MDPIPSQLKKMANDNYTDEFGQVMSLPEIKKVVLHEHEKSKSLLQKSNFQTIFSARKNQSKGKSCFHPICCYVKASHFHNGRSKRELFQPGACFLSKIFSMN